MFASSFSRISKLLLVLALSGTVLAQRGACKRAYNECMLHIWHDNEVLSRPYEISNEKADQAFTWELLFKDPNKTLGVDNLQTNGIVPEVIERGRKPYPITELGLQETSFKPYYIHSWGSGVGHQAMTDEQYDAIDGKCIRMYFTSYQLLDRPYGTVIGNYHNVPKKDNMCIVFKVRA